MNALRLTVGAGKRNAQGARVEVPVGPGGAVETVAEFLRTRAPEREAWWFLADFDGGYRDEAHWRSACGVPIDSDYQDENGEHGKVTIPAEVADEVLAAAHAGRLPGNLLHFTPHGARIAFLFSRETPDGDERDRAAKGACALVADALARAGVAPNGTPKGLAVDACSEKRVQFMYAPNAVVGDVARSAEVVVLRREPYDVGTLVAAAPAGPVSVAAREPGEEGPDETAPRAATTDIRSAMAAWNAAHPLDIPTSGGRCPACGHDGCFGMLGGDDPQRWSCFSANHERDSTRCGIRGPTCWHGDALDLAAREAGLSLVEVLRRDGLLADEPVQAGRAPSSHGENAERHLLAAMVRDPAVARAGIESAGGVVASDFRLPMHVAVAVALDKIAAGGRSPDTVTLAAELAADKRVSAEDIGRLLELARTVDTANAAVYARIVRSEALDRSATALAQRVSEGLKRGGAHGIAAAREALAELDATFAPAVKEEPAFRWVSAQDLLAEDDHVVEFLWHPVVAKECMTLLVAGAKGGKTWILFSRLGAMSRRVPFLGCAPLDRVPLVLLVSEEPRWVIQKRLRQFGVTNVDVLTLDAMPAGATWDGILAEAGRRAEEVGAEWLVFDTVSTLAAIEDENDAAAVNAALVAASKLARTSGRAVTLVHHLGRGGGIRGSTVFDAVPDCLVEVKTVGGESSRRRAMHVRGRLPDRPEGPVVVEWSRGIDGEPDTHRLVSTKTPADEKADREHEHVRRVDGKIVGAVEDAARARRWPWLRPAAIVEATGLPGSDVRERLPVLSSTDRVQRQPAPGKGGGFWYAALGVALPEVLAKAEEDAARAAEEADAQAAEEAARKASEEAETKAAKHAANLSRDAKLSRVGLGQVGATAEHVGATRPKLSRAKGQKCSKLTGARGKKRNTRSCPNLSQPVPNLSQESTPESERSCPERGTTQGVPALGQVRETGTTSEEKSSEETGGSR